MPGLRTWWSRLAARLRAWRSGGSASKRLGARGERLAARYLRRQGFRVLARNARVPMGEADLICTAPDGVTIVLVEVKTRAADAAAWSPEDAVGPAKQRTLAAILRYLVRANRWHGRPTRIDIVAIENAHARHPRLRHLPSAVPTAATR